MTPRAGSQPQPPEALARPARADLRILHVTRELGDEARFGLGRSVQQLIDGQRRLGALAEKLCADDLAPDELQQATARADRWRRRTPASLQGLWPLISRAMAVGELAARRVHQSHRTPAEPGPPGRPSIGPSFGPPTEPPTQPITHVHCHDAVVAASLRRGLAAANLHRAVGWGVTLHGFDSVGRSLHEQFTPLPAWLRARLWWGERRTLAAADWVIALTQRGADRVTARLHLHRAAHWHVVPHARPAWTLPDRQSSRRALGLADDEHCLLAVGQLVPGKRFDWIVRAMGSAPPGWRLVLLGAGERAPLEQLAKSAGIAAPLIAVSDRPALYYAAADAYASASATESFGLANLEALHAGLPALCTAVGGVPEVVGDAALLVDDDFKKFSHALGELLNNADLQRTLVHRAAMRLADWPDIDAIAARHLAICAGNTAHTPTDLAASPGPTAMPNPPPSPTSGPSP